MDPPGRLSALDPKPDPMEDAARCALRAPLLERGALDRELEERIAEPLRLEAAEPPDPAAPTALESPVPLMVIDAPLAAAPAPALWDPPPPPPPDPPLDPPPPLLLPRLELPELPRLPKLELGPPRPLVPRLPRICGAIRDTNFSACVVPVSLTMRSTFPPWTVCVRVTAVAEAVPRSASRRWLYIQPATPAAAKPNKTNHLPLPPRFGG